MAANEREAAAAGCHSQIVRNLRDLRVIRVRSVVISDNLKNFP